MKNDEIIPSWDTYLLEELCNTLLFALAEDPHIIFLGPTDPSPSALNRSVTFLLFFSTTKERKVVKKK
jgi:hypothetical protein